MIEKAEQELRVAYKAVIENIVARYNAHEIIALYKNAFRYYRDGNKLAAERWARAVKHLARAFGHEANIAYLKAHANEIPFLTGATAEEYDLHEHSDTVQDLLNSVATHIPVEPGETPDLMRRYTRKSKEHLEALARSGERHELLRTELIKTAYEYSRAVECLELAYEAEAGHPAAA